MNAEFYFNRGIEKSRANDLQGAVEDYSNAIALSSGTERKPIVTNNPDGSTVTVNVIEESTGYENMYFNRACAYLDLQNYDSAIKDLSKFIEYNQNDPEVYFKRAIAYSYLNKDDDAKRDLKLANSLDSNYNDQAFRAAFGG